MEGRNDIRDWLALGALPGLGCVLIRRLLDTFGTPAQVLAAGKSVAEVTGLHRNVVGVFSSSSQLDKARFWADQEYKRVCAANIQLLCCDDPLYPSLLLNIHDVPILLYCLGDLDSLNFPALAIVGSRIPTDYGRNISTKFGRQLAGNGFAVVSGLAQGIDGQAHYGALEANGKTIAVLGCGLDVVYPRKHARLYRQIEEQGLLLSEYPLGSPPEKFRFPARNRIISGLSLGVVIVEAAVRSGALITARLALEQNREVFAVPGRIDSPKSEGPHGLLRQGAVLVRSVEDILAEFPSAVQSVPPHFSSHILPVAPAKVPVKSITQLPGDLSQEEKKLLTVITTEPIDIEQLSEATAQPLNALHSLLLGLELRGLIQQLPGQQYIRCK
jgi:DNA processing protein